MKDKMLKKKKGKIEFTEIWKPVRIKNLCNVGDISLRVAISEPIPMTRNMTLLYSWSRALFRGGHSIQRLASFQFTGFSHLLIAIRCKWGSRCQNDGNIFGIVIAPFWFSRRQSPRLTLGSQTGERTPKKVVFQLSTFVLSSYTRAIV